MCNAYFSIHLKMYINFFISCISVYFLENIILLQQKIRDLQKVNKSNKASTSGTNIVGGKRKLKKNITWSPESSPIKKKVCSNVKSVSTRQIVVISQKLFSMMHLFIK